MNILFKDQYHHLNHQELYSHHQNVLIDNHNHQVIIKLFDQQFLHLYLNHMLLQVDKNLEQTMNNFLTHQPLNRFWHHPIAFIHNKYLMVNEDHYHLVSDIFVLLVWFINALFAFSLRCLIDTQHNKSFLFYFPLISFFNFLSRNKPFKMW